MGDAGVPFDAVAQDVAWLFVCGESPMADRQLKVRQVREQTRQPYSDCAQALAEAGGDVDRAVDRMRLRGEMYTVDVKDAFNARFDNERGPAGGE